MNDAKLHINCFYYIINFKTLLTIGPEIENIYQNIIVVTE